MLNLSFKANERNFPIKSEATCLKLLKALIRINPPGFLLEAMWVAGPEPIDLPNKRIFFS